MIYQFKISLKHMKPPIWRRIQVDSSTTFRKLHELIQIAFNWEDNHLHEFQVKVSKKMQELQKATQKIGSSLFSQEQITIGMPERDEVFGGDAMLDEKEAELGDFLMEEKDKCRYVYDFGDDWQHEILLEKVMAPEAKSLYPRCIKAMRSVPPEDSRDWWENEPDEDLPNQEILNEINDRFRKFQGKPAEDEVSCQDEGNWLYLFALVDQYKKLEPWEWIDDNQIISIGLPESDDVAYCSVLGGASGEYGLTAYLGDDGLRVLLNVLEDRGDYKDYIFDQRSLWLSFSDRDDLASQDLELIKNQGLSFHGRRQWPMFRSFSPGYYPWFLDQDEVSLFIILLEQVIDVAKQAKENPELINASETRKWFLRSPKKNRKKGLWTDGLIIPTVESRVEPVQLHVSELKIKQLKNNYRLLNTPIEFASFYGPEPVQDQKDERPYYPNFVIVVDRKKEFIIYSNTLKQEQYEKNLQGTFLEMIGQLERIPREVWIESEKAAKILQPLFKLLSIKLMKVDKLPVATNVRREMLQGMDS